MSEWRFLAPEMFGWLLLAPALALLVWYAAWAKRNAAKRFSLQPRQRGSRPAPRAALLGLAALLTALALMRPAGDRIEEVIPSSGRDVAFVIDVSRSMLADDLAPSRLARAKLAVRDAVEAMRGDRVALVAFAGLPSVKCPLTLDYAFFLMALDDLGTDSAPRGGSLLGDALRRTVRDVFGDSPGGRRDIVLITDGEDQGSYPIEAAGEAAAAGVRLIVLGLGDDQTGRRIPADPSNAPGVFVRHQGRDVWSQLDSGLLRQVAAQSPGGIYFHVATGAVDLEQIYREVIAAAGRRPLEAQKRERYSERFQLFLLGAFVLLVADLALGRAWG